MVALSSSSAGTVWSGSTASTPADRLREVADLYPGATAIVGDGNITYEDFDRAVSRIANLVAELTLPGDRVGLVVDDVSDHLAALFAVFRSGRVAVPLDLANPAQRLAHIVDHAGVSLLLVENAGEGEALGLGHLPEAEIAVAADRSEVFEGHDLDADAPAQILYTSGSTGVPKGVWQSHRYLIDRCRAEASFYGFTETDRLSQLFPISFAASNGHSFGALLNGACLVPYDLEGLGLQHIPDWVEAYEVTGLAMVPTLFRRAFARIDQPEKLRSVRFVMVGGEVALSSDLEHFNDAFARNAVLIHRLASTETDAITYRVFEHGEIADGSTLSAGRPAPGKRLLIVSDDGESLPAGSEGELFVESDQLVDGYWADPELTAAKFTTSDDGSRLFRTGDLARFEKSGELVHLGRRDGRVKIRGNGVDIIEVENSLLAIAGIEECVVKAFDNAAGEAYLVGFFTAHLPVDTRALRTQMLDVVPDYMVPQRLVQLDDMPLTPRGKIDRSSLEEPARSQEADVSAVLTDTESVLVGLWANVLGLKEVPKDVSFFDLGGNSAGAYQLIADIHHELGVDIPASSMLDAVTLERQAALIDSGEHHAAASVVQIKIGSGTPIFGMHAQRGGVLYLETLAAEMSTERPFFGVQPETNESAPDYRPIEKMAEDYVAAVKEVQPEGPYSLMGNCFGGLVAREMADLLVRDDNDVDLLVMIDPPTPGEKEAVDQGWTLTRLDRAIRARIARPRARWRRRRAARAEGGDKLARGELLKRLHERARAEYEPAPSEVPLLVFAAADSEARQRRNWENLSPGGFDLIRLPSYHFEILKPASRQKIAAVLDGRLARLEQHV